MIKLIGECF